jgi:hypothetical protein
VSQSRALSRLVLYSYNEFHCAAECHYTECCGTKRGIIKSCNFFFENEKEKENEIFKRTHFAIGRGNFLFTLLFFLSRDFFFIQVSSLTKFVNVMTGDQRPGPISPNYLPIVEKFTLAAFAINFLAK